MQLVLPCLSLQAQAALVLQELLRDPEVYRALRRLVARQRRLQAARARRAATPAAPTQHGRRRLGQAPALGAEATASPARVVRAARVERSSAGPDGPRAGPRSLSVETKTQKKQKKEK
jgi:hypothetical protein